ncbi:MAG: FkbM family methyltransferase [Vicinamibacterales bacterium]
MLQRLYAWVLWQLSGHSGVPWRLPDGTMLKLDPRCRWIRHAAYEADVVRYARSIAREGDVVIDVGAHVGFYALQAALWVGPSGRVMAFEPNPLARDVLTTNVRLNRLEGRVIVEAFAVADAPGVAAFFGGEDTSGLSRLGAPNAISNHARSIDVSVVSLDGYCSDRTIRPSLIIMDVEGAELNVLRGARALLTELPVPAIVEIHPQLWPTFETTAAGFRTYAESVRRSIVPLTGQRDPLGEYGTVALLPDAERTERA